MSTMTDERRAELRQWLTEEARRFGTALPEPLDTAMELMDAVDALTAQLDEARRLSDAAMSLLSEQPLVRATVSSPTGSGSSGA